MKLDFEKWVKGNTPEETSKLASIDSEFGKLIDRLDDNDIDRESIFIYGMFNLLEYLHLRNNDLLHRLTILLESYINFVRMRTNYKDYRELPTDIKITELGEEYDINITSVIDYMSDGSAECFSLVRAMSDYVQLVNLEKVKNKGTQFRNRTKH